MVHLRNHLRYYAPIMIGFGTLILVGDGIVILLRLLGVEKWTAFYLALLILCFGIYATFNRRRSHSEECVIEDEVTTGETR